MLSPLTQPRFTHSPLIFGGGIRKTGLTMNGSIIFNGSNEHLRIASFSSSSPNQRTFTISSWLRTANLAATQALLDFRDSAASATDEYLLQIQASGTDFFSFGINNSSTVMNENKVTFLSAADTWYHVVVAVDTTNATASNRVRAYINNVEQTLVESTVITQNTNLEAMFDNAGVATIGATAASTPAGFWNGKLADVIVVEGQALTPSEFGYDNGGTWSWKNYTGSFGTHGFRLNPQDSSQIGTDQSGNGKNFTLTNMDATNFDGTDLPPV